MHGARLVPAAALAALVLAGCSNADTKTLQDAAIDRAVTATGSQCQQSSGKTGTIQGYASFTCALEDGRLFLAMIAGSADEAAATAKSANASDPTMIYTAAEFGGVHVVSAVSKSTT